MLDDCDTIGGAYSTVLAGDTLCTRRGRTFEYLSGLLS
jgi:hypothetical protein